MAAKLKVVVSEFQTNTDCSGHLSRSSGEYGENSAVGYSSGPRALDAWYNEVKLTNPSAGSFDHKLSGKVSKLRCSYKDCLPKTGVGMLFVLILIASLVASHYPWLLVCSLNSSPDPDSNKKTAHSTLDSLSSWLNLNLLVNHLDIKGYSLLL